METIIFIIVIFIVLAILSEVIKNPGLKVFKATPQGARAEFLKLAFRITTEDCRYMRFDGQRFHHFRKIPYEKYIGIYMSGFTIVDVDESHLPHTESWKYQRIDGGPDLRHKGNKKNMRSQQNIVNFYGQKKFLLYVYTHPKYDEVDLNGVVKRLDSFLCGAKKQNYESDFSEFNVAFEAKKQCESQLNQALSDVLTCEKVVAAYDEIKHKVSNNKDAKAKVKEATKRLYNLKNSIFLLYQEIEKYKKQQKAAVQSAKSQCKVALHCRTIDQFS